MRRQFEGIRGGSWLILALERLGNQAGLRRRARPAQPAATRSRRDPGEDQARNPDIPVASQGFARNGGASLDGRSGVQRLARGGLRQRRAKPLVGQRTPELSEVLEL